MTKTEPRTLVPANPFGHAGRLARVQTELKAVCDARAELPVGTWLRRMAGCRREMAAIYRGASRDCQTDSIEWHAMTDAAQMLELHARANLNAADEADVTTTVDGAK